MEIQTNNNNDDDDVMLAKVLNETLNRDLGISIRKLEFLGALLSPRIQPLALAQGVLRRSFESSTFLVAFGLDPSYGEGVFF